MVADVSNDGDALERSVRDAYELRARVVQRFFERNADAIARLCHEMARRFARGGRLLAFGAGAAATDAQHVSVEFVHPVIVGKRALPAIALPNDAPSALGLATADSHTFLARQLKTVATHDDIALGMVHSPDDTGLPAVVAALKQARAMAMLTLRLGALRWARTPRDLGTEEDYYFEVPSDDPFVVQEVHETLYHVLWELVHVFFEHKGLLDASARTHDGGASSFLYPFLSAAESDLDRVLQEVRDSAVAKARDVTDMRSASCDPAALIAAARAVAERLGDGAKVLAFGNGGSATDAQDLVTDLVAPPAGMRRFPALSLTNDAAVITAVGNDVGFDNVFARQVIAYGRPGDVGVAISTSGGSRNVLAAIEEARRRDLVTVGLSGYGGGRQAELCDHVLVVHGDYIPRIQEAQATQYHLLRHLVERLLV